MGTATADHRDPRRSRWRWSAHEATILSLRSINLTPFHSFHLTERPQPVASVHSLSAQARAEAQRACSGDVGTNHVHESYLASRYPRSNMYLDENVVCVECAVS